MNVKDIIRPAMILFIICLVSSALLAVTNSFTEDPIAKAAAETQSKAAVTVLPQADTVCEDEKTINYAGKDYSYFEGLDKDGNVVGYAIKSSAKGYGGDVDIITGVDTSGKVTGVEILDMEETPGLGMRAKEQDFRDQYIGLAAGIKIDTATKKSGSENKIDAMTGATITSTAVTESVNTALEIFGQIGGALNG